MLFGKLLQLSINIVKDFFQADRKRIKKSDKDVAAQIKKLTKHNVMVINGFVDNDDPNGVPVFQSARET